MPLIEIKGASKGFGLPGSRTEVLKNINLSVEKGEFVVIVGYSGTGKSTLINLISGLVKPDTGEALIEGKKITEPGPDRGLVFQNYSLLPWLTVEENIALAVDEVFKDWSPEQRKAHVAKYIAMVKLTPAAHKLPKELSGGMRKRAGLARALAMNPELLLYDEPTTGLDPITTDYVDEMILDAKKELGVTSVVISHDIASAFKVADNIAFLYQGHIVDQGHPTKLRHSEHPAVKVFLSTWFGKN